RLAPCPSRPRSCRSPAAWPGPAPAPFRRSPRGNAASYRSWSRSLMFAAMTAPLNVGLIGAGPWPRMVTGPVLAAGPETTVTGVWSRTSAHAAEFAEQLGVAVFDDVDALFDSCDAVAIAVAPEAQPELAVRAVRKGKALLLEKPLAADVAGARAIADAVHDAGVGALVM